MITKRLPKLNRKILRSRCRPARRLRVTGQGLELLLGHHQDRLGIDVQEVQEVQEGPGVLVEDPEGDQGVL